MARKSKEEALRDIHSEAVQEFDDVQSALRDVRLECLKDRRFYSIAGAQWEGPLGDQFENKPKFEVNKVHLAVIRIFNEYRNNRITVNYVPKDGSEADELSDTCNDLYRSTEQDSVAEEAYDNAFEEAVGGGFGAWRLRNDYENPEDDEDERQKICIEPIFDADSSVFFDLNAKRQDKSDAKRCWVVTAMTTQAYKNEYKDDPANWPKEIHQLEFDWLTPDVVYVAEYYKVEEKKVTVSVYRDALGSEEQHDDEELDEIEEGEEGPTLRQQLTAKGFRLVKSKKINRRKVHKYILSGGKVLEDCGYIAGPNIPIVPVYGKRWFVDNVERCMGHVRLAMDSQRLKNMQLSKLGELSALSSVEKPILTPEQVAGHQVMWSEDNIKDYPYLLINQITDMNGAPLVSGPVGYTKPPQVPPAMAALLQITETDMQDLLGNQQAGEELQPNMSGKAVELIQNRLDMQSFIYMSNMAKAVKRSGEIWLGMAKEVFVERGRKVKGINTDGKPRSIELLKAKLNDQQVAYMANDMSTAALDVAVEVGPSSSSKRAATVRALTGMMSITQDPETLQVLGAMSMMNMEGEGISEVRDFFRQKLLKMGAVKPTEEEARGLAEDLANQKPDAQEEYFRSAAENEQAKAIKARADTILTVTKADESKANTLKIMSEVDATEQQQALEVIDRIGANRQMAQAAPTQPPMGE